MLDLNLFLVVILILLLFGAFAFLSHQAAKKRAADMQLLAHQLGLQFHANKDYSFDERYNFINKLCEGDARYAYNVITGDYRDHQVLAFDYHYETTSTDSDGDRHTTHHHISFFILQFDQNFPELLIHQEGWWSKIKQFMGFDDIDFESAEFSKAFVVKSPDKRFAYDICHGRMIEYLLENRDLNIEIERNCLTLFFATRLKTTQIQRNLNRLIKLREMFPEYLSNA